MPRSDNFNRADNAATLGTPSDGGSAWVEAGTWSVESNQAKAAGNDASAILDDTISDIDVQVTLAVTGNTAGVVARATDNNHYVFLRVTGSALEIFRYDGAGNYALLGTVGISPANGDVLKLRASGSSLTGYLNGVAILGPITETFNQTATKHGLWNYGGTAVRYDNFTSSAVGGVATPAPTLDLLGCG